MTPHDVTSSLTCRDESSTPATPTPVCTVSRATTSSTVRACAASRAHAPARGDHEESEESAAHRLGLTLADVSPHLLTHEPLPTEILARATITNAERERLTGVATRTALGIVCGEFSPLPEIPALSMPPLSAAPGILLAGEIVKDRIGAANALGHQRNVLSTGILSGQHARWLSHRAKQPGCECGDPAYRGAYRRRHPWLATDLGAKPTPH